MRDGKLADVKGMDESVAEEVAEWIVKGVDESAILELDSDPNVECD